MPKWSREQISRHYMYRIRSLDHVVSMLAFMVSMMMFRCGHASHIYLHQSINQCKLSLYCSLNSAFNKIRVAAIMGTRCSCFNSDSEITRSRCLLMAFAGADQPWALYTPNTYPRYVQDRILRCHVSSATDAASCSSCRPVTCIHQAG